MRRSQRTGIPTAPGRAIQIDQMRALGLLAAAVLVIGSLGPWGKLGIITISGTDGDGVVTAIAGAVASVFIVLDRAT